MFYTQSTSVVYALCISHSSKVPKLKMSSVTGNKVSQKPIVKLFDSDSREDQCESTLRHEARVITVTELSVNTLQNAEKGKNLPPSAE